MAMRGLLRNLTGRIAEGEMAPEAEEAPPPPIDYRIADQDRLAMLHSLEETGLVWFWATDAAGNLTYLSESALDKIDPDGALLNRPLMSIAEVVPDVRRESSERPLSFYLGSRTRFSDVSVRLKSAGKPLFWRISGRPHFDSEANFIGFRGQASDISLEHEQQQADTQMAQFDALTGLANRHRMNLRLESNLNVCKAAKRSCALLMLDLDRFKQVNDKLGHPAGDDLLRQVGQRLQRILPKEAEIGRLGGDEFQVIIPDQDDRSKLGDLAQRVIQMISQPYVIDGMRAIIGTSIGIAIAPYDGVESDDLVKSADLALYAAKRGGRAQYRFFANDLAHEAASLLEMGQDLSEAMENDSLAMHYQPIVRASDNTVVTFEALLRWDHPERGPISPGIFIPVAEETGLIDKLGEWALRRACFDAAEWPGNIIVAVNLSAEMFASEDLIPIIRSALSQSGLRTNQLELELTEGVFLGESEAVDYTFAQLKKLGVRLSLDDFGTGYASLGYLRRASFDKIKVDQSFVRGCTEENSTNAAIITAIVSLAGALDMITTAEGVETMDELEVVRRLGVDTVQGFLYSKAVPQELAKAKLKSDDFVYDPVGPDKQRAERRSQFRRVGVIHEDHRYEAMLRNLSRTGALIEGLLNVPLGTELVLDLGEGQLVVATVRRSQDASQGLQFETQLISDGANGLCTAHRVSPYALVAAGMPLKPLQPGSSLPESTGTRARFLQVDVAVGHSRAA